MSAPTVVNAPQECPTCHRGDGLTDVDERWDAINQVDKVVKCTNCDTEWIEHYHLTSWEVTKK